MSSNMTPDEHRTEAALLQALDELRAGKKPSVIVVTYTAAGKTLGVNWCNQTDHRAVLGTLDLAKLAVREDWRR